MENVVKRLPEEEQWTHYFAKREKYSQLDYLLPSAALADASPEPPEIVRGGLPLRAEHFTGKRFKGSVRTTRTPRITVPSSRG